MGLGDDVKQVASSVGSAVGGIVSDTAKTVAKTPLDILEEILGGKPSSDAGGKPATPEKPETESGDHSAGDDAAKRADIQQKLEVDKQEQAQHLQQHRQVLAQEQQYYEQQKAQAEQMKAVEEKQKEEQKKFEIKQLEKQKRENLSLKIAQDANNPEKSRNLGAG